MSLQVYQVKEPFAFESGLVLSGLKIGFHTYGEINSRRDNVIWVCHALTANSDVLDWWKGLFGANDYFNPKDYFIICANVLGSPYGSTHPLDINPETNEVYGLNFPQFTIRDIVKAHRLLAEHLNITSIEVLIGGSLGGQQAIEWSIIAPQQIKYLILMATNAKHSPWGIAFNESQRLALEADHTFMQNKPGGGVAGLKAARSIALLSYRHYNTYALTQGEDTTDKTDKYKAASYQNYQGDKLTNRYNAYSYWFLTKAMDSHHVGRGRISIETALHSVAAKTLVISITSDILFPPEEQHYLADCIPGAKYVELESVYGHDGFLIETAELTKIISSFMAYTDKI